MVRRVLRFFREWWHSPSLLDQFLSLPSNPEILELTEDMKLGVDPFGRFKRNLDATR
jgi:hypothetical protein